MNQKQRQKYIAEILRIKGSISTNELVKKFGVSKMTIGRDLKKLEALGIAEPFHGGAMYKDSNVLEYPIVVKQDLFVNEKQRIAKAAVQNVADGSSIFIGAGTTALAVSLELLAKKDCTFYTNSLSVVNYFAKVKDLDLHVIPGKYRSMSDGFLGIEATEYITNLYFDYCFMGTDGVAQDGTISVHSADDALTKKMVVEHTKSASLVFDHSKVGKKLLHGFSNATNFEHIITDYQEMATFFSEKLQINSPSIITV
ncbi:DeoR/GlpR family DNA-binding transcription regulator [Lactobacillus sp. ESL0791]|uniref:DeoR/GlpR family DNA-binding transcription regulator n=1 Tax=Lactobacillus sp. ESL0791 TaxID=2983234 RepID=UPI0023F9CF8F|nr:DeoR/GlpR family DNA-binding transcription regulator [Lactobacillus sp. ESL0791]MDF7639391.1 DeoR/GlpR family DNA-binding transcription regulator [Lactobacillus sp. ESL0791]